MSIFSKTPDSRGQELAGRDRNRHSRRVSSQIFARLCRTIQILVPQAESMALSRVLALFLADFMKNPHGVSHFIGLAVWGW